MPKAQLTVGSLFSGAGLCDLGLERADFRHTWFCEIEDFPRRVLTARWPGIPIHRDIREINAQTVPTVDLLAGGFPCQDVSTGGNRAGIREGTRSGLWFEFRRVIEELRPPWVLIENVRGLLSCGIEIVLKDLAAIGYDAEWEVLPASIFGAPHIRERVFFVAYPHRKRRGRSPRVFTPDRGDLADHFQLDRQALWNGVRIDRARSLPDRLALPVPRVYRVDDGSADVLDRLKCLGNGIVPHQARYVGELIQRAAARE